MTQTTALDARTPHHRRRRALAAACGLALALVPAHAAQARLGDLDPGFGVGGIARPDVGAGAARFEAITLAGGQPLAAGWALNGAAEEAVVAKLTTAGGPDSAFGTSGVTRVPAGGFVRRLHGMALDAQGRVLAAGDQRATTAPVGQTTPVVLRFSAAGARELPFPGTVGGAFGEAHAVAPGPAGTIYVGGWRTSPLAGIDVFFVAQLDAAGNLLTTGFGGGDGIAEASFGIAAHAEAMAIAPNGDIVLAGWSTAPGAGPPQHRPALARFDANGAPVAAFGTGGILNPLGMTLGELRSVQVDAAGRITAAGVSGTDALVIRRLAGGEPDTTFGQGGATLGAVAGGAQLHGLALDGARSLVAGAGGTQLLLGALDVNGTPEPGLGGAPAGWRTFTAAGAALEGFGAAAGPGGTAYTAGALGSPSGVYLSRHLGNAAPVAALAAPAQVQAGAPATLDAGASSDPEGEPLRFAFDLDGNGTYEFDGGANPLAFRTFPAPGAYTVGVRVTDPRGGAATATAGVQVVPAAVAPPQARLGRQGVAKPLSGVIRYRLPGTKRFVPLTELSAIPNGTEIDARKGRVLLTVLHDASGALDGARFYAGRFIFKQGKGRVPLTTLRLSGGSFAGCGAGQARRARSVRSVASIASVKGGKGSKAKKPVRKLWGDGRGKFRTKGRYGAATVRGTKWLTLDRCDGTLVSVERGRVAVEALQGKPRLRLVRAGKQTLVPAKRSK